MRELLPWEETVIKRLGVTDPERARQLLHKLTEDTQIVGGRLVTLPNKEK